MNGSALSNNSLIDLLLIMFGNQDQISPMFLRRVSLAEHFEDASAAYVLGIRKQFPNCQYFFEVATMNCSRRGIIGISQLPAYLFPFFKVDS